MNKNSLIERILIVGLGNMGSKHLDIIRKSLPRSQIFLFSDRLNDNFTLPNLADGLLCNLDEVINFSPQIIVVANAASNHLKIIKKLTKLNSHFLVEKPITHNLKNANEVFENIETQERVFHVGYNLRFLDALIKFKEIIKTDKLGSVFSISAEVGQYLPDWRSGFDYRKSVSAQKKLGGGVLLELSHEIDYLLWIFGNVRSISAFVNKASNLDIDVEDQAILKLKFDNLCSQKNEVVATLHMDFFRRDTSRSCTVIGSKGTLRIDVISGEISFFDSNLSQWEVIYQSSNTIQETYLAQWDSFINCIKDNRQPKVSIGDALKVISIIEGAKKSNIEGCKFVPFCGDLYLS